MTSDQAATFEPHRRRLRGLAHRMLGSIAEAEDAVQAAYQRWHQVDFACVADPRAFLTTTTTRICLDVLKSARSVREADVGPWLPDPVLDDHALAPDAQTELADDLSVALLLVLERLLALERAAFLLHDVFDYSFAEVAAALGRSDTAVASWPAGRAPACGRRVRQRRRPRVAPTRQTRSMPRSSRRSSAPPARAIWRRSRGCWRAKPGSSPMAAARSRRR